jgi:FkbM family methyltransferase
LGKAGTEATVVGLPVASPDRDAHSDGLKKMALISYGQNHEDVLLNRLFPMDQCGFYIDVGACHPVIHSVTKLFYERGWQGINIEPVPASAEMLVRDRKRDVNLAVGLSNREGACRFYECLRAAELSTFCDERAEKVRQQGYELIEHLIPVTTLARVCEQYAERTIDFLKVDVERYEREVLEGGDWRRFRPRVVVVESTLPQTSIPSFDDWEPLLLAADYLFAFFDGLNRYYVRAEDRELIPLLAVPANVFDEFESYDHHWQIYHIRHAFEASQESLGTTQSALNFAETALVDAHDSLAITRRALDDSQIALDGMRAELEATQLQLEASQLQFESSQLQLEASQVQLAPFQELGPIAIGVARRLRRMSNESPKLASIAKRFIRRAHQRARPLVPGA